jgi:hypothetical protein
MTDPRSDTKPARKAPPPLAWIILAILVVIVVLAVVQRQGTHVTASGGTMPQANEAPGGPPSSPNDR